MKEISKNLLSVLLFVLITYASFSQSVNQSPILDSVGDKIIEEGMTLEFTLNAIDPDGDSLTYSVSHVPEGASFNSSTGAFSWNPDYNQAGNYILMFTVTDGELIDSEEITVTIVDAVLDNVVTALIARHYQGQTILTWNEITTVSSAVPETMTMDEVRNLRTSLQGISYNIYRSNNPISSVQGLTPIKTVGVLSGWNTEFYGRDNNASHTNQSFRYVVEIENEDIPSNQVSKDTAVCAYNPQDSGMAYYAVTVVENGEENTFIGTGNTIDVIETVGQGVPVLQRVETRQNWYYTTGISTHYFYTRWESPPHSNIHGRPIDYMVVIPDKYDASSPMPAIISFHGWGGSLQGMSWWFNFEAGTIVITSNQEPYDWWTGYHELRDIGIRSQQNWENGVVRPYSQNRVSSFFDFVASKWNVDQSRTILSGISMGGSGSIMYSIRNPDRVAWTNSWVGVHVPAESPTFRSSYQVSYGEYDWQIKYEDNITPAFSFYDDDWYLRNHISDETPFITFSNGKNDAGIGWGQAVKFARALQETKRPFIFYWGMGGHNQRTMNPPDLDGNRSQTVNPIDIRINQTLPAFTNCSLDGNPGNGDPADGDEEGQMNAYMYWRTDDIVDEPQNWEMTVGIVHTAPASSCTVSLTPRRIQQFLVSPSYEYLWTNRSLTTNSIIQTGNVIADNNGLITIDDLIIEQITRQGGGNRISIIANSTNGETFEIGKNPTREIHVSESGNDVSGDGSIQMPFRSIGRAVTEATPGTAVRIHSGIYLGRTDISGLAGTFDSPIWIGGISGETKPVITNASEGFHLSSVRYLIIHDLEITGVSDNGINCDDGGDYSNIDASRHLVFRNLSIHDIGNTGNQDGIKLSGVNDYFILDSEIYNCGGFYGSGIDHVGCHNGLIARNYLHDLAGNAVQCKGGSENIEIRANRIIECGERGINIGGYSDLQYFRPPVSSGALNYEARNISAIANFIKGSEAALAFVNAIDCLALNNTVIDPHSWVLRILQENTGNATYEFGPCGSNTIANNIFVYDGLDISQYGALNVGNNTAPETFFFSNNLWYNRTSPQNSNPNLPVTEVSGIYGEDPQLLDIAIDDFRVLASSPAAGAGLAFDVLTTDFVSTTYTNPPNIGAYATTLDAVTDTTAPSVPADLVGVAISSNTINLSWSASTDNVGVTGYRVYRNGTPAGTSTTATYSDEGLNAATQYSYTVLAFDAAGNESAHSATVQVSTQDGPAGRTVRVTTTAELRSAINNAQSNDTILVADGTYQNGSPLVLNGADNVTLRGESLDAANVILNGRSLFTAGGLYDELDDILRIRTCNTVRIEHVTFTEAHGYGIKLELDGTANPNGIYIENCRFINIGTRLIKGTADPSDLTKRIRGGSVRNCYFENTVIPPSTGGWHFEGAYIAAIDLMCLAGWTFEDNEFRNVRGQRGEGRSAIFVWNHSEDITIQRNKIVNCDRGITLGLSDLTGAYHVDGAIVRNNFITVGSVAGFTADAGIECWSVNDVKLYNNTVWRSDTASGRGIRFINNISNTEIVNNLIRGRLIMDNAGINLDRNQNNIFTDISSDYFIGAATGDLRLTPIAIEAINAGVVLADVTEDFSGGPRDADPNIGASEYVGTVEDDTQAPTIPMNLTGTPAASATAISLTWSASTDDVGVTGYCVFRNGDEIGQSVTNSYTDTGLNPLTQYSYTVLAFDAAGNESAQCAPVSLTTPEIPVDPNLIRAQFVGSIDASMKANLRSIYQRGAEKGRTPGLLGQWGDSITNSQAYLGAIGSWGLVTTPPSNGHDYVPILLWMGATPHSNDNPLSRNKGGAYCAESGWRVTDGLAAIDDAIIRANPSWALTMYGTNDIRSGWNPVAYERGLRRFIQINIDEGIIPVLSTIPPCVGYDAQVIEANTIVGRVAENMNIPLVDLYGLFMILHPTDWADILLGDGVHPSHTYGGGDLSDESMRNDGYNIRSILTLDMAEKIKRIVFDNGTPDGGELPIVIVSSSSHPYKTVTNGLLASFSITSDSGTLPTGYSYDLDQVPNTVPDTSIDGTSSTVMIDILEKGEWFFHVRAVSDGIWGPVVHYPFTAWDNPVTVLRRENATSVVYDTFVSSNWGGDDNFGAGAEMNIYNGDSYPTSRGLYRFDLSGVQSDSINSARIVFFTPSPVDRDIDYEVFQITGSWAEGTGTWANNDHSGVVWNDGLTFGANPVDSGTLLNGFDRIEVEVTSLVRNWLNGSIANNGIMIQHSQRYTSLRIVASEYGCKDMRPTLIIEYAEANYPPVIMPISPLVKYEGELIQLELIVTDENIGDEITIIPEALPIGAELTQTSDRVWQLTWQTGFSNSGSYSFSFTANDGQSNSEVMSASLTINDVDTSMTLSNKPAWFKNE